MRNIDEDIITQAMLKIPASKTLNCSDIRSEFCTSNDNFSLAAETITK